MRVRIALLICKIIRFILVKLGRGGSLPGKIALRICPDFLSYIKYPEVVVMVTGTNGKTTTSNMVFELLKKQYPHVAGNRKGDNLEEGITTLVVANTGLSLKVKTNALVMEVDELNVPKVLSKVKVSHFIVNNFFRDQLDRAGEMETIVAKIEKALATYHGALLLNGNDPNVARLGYHRANTYYFGVKENENSVKTTQEASEGKFCFHCNSPLMYSFYQYSHIGEFKCPNCDFGDFGFLLQADYVDLNTSAFGVDNTVFRAPQDALYSIYNCMALISLAKMLGVSFQLVNEVLSHFELKDGRMEMFQIGKPCLLNLIKNPTGANEVMKYIMRNKEDKDILIVLNDNDQDGTDVSWIWDANFELIMDESVKSIICSGLRAYDMALRLKYAGFKGDILVNKAMEEALVALKGTSHLAYVIATYTALQPMRSILRRYSS